MTSTSQRYVDTSNCPLNVQLTQYSDLKLRDIEILVQQQIEEDEAAEKDSGVLKEIQTILYSTEVGPSP